MALTTVKSIDQWNPQDACIERIMDNAAYTSAHPDDTLVLVGPARFSSLGQDQGAANTGSLKPVGMLQQLGVSQQRAVQPLQAIGSGRNYFLAGKPIVQFNIGRLFAKGSNLYRALYQNIMTTDSQMGFNPKEPPSTADNPHAIFNLDSEMFLVPFGIGVAFRDKSGASLGSFYMESCMIASYQISVASGQNVIMENVSGSADRLLPVNLGNSVSNFFKTEGEAAAQVTTEDNTGYPTTDFSVPVAGE